MTIGTGCGEDGKEGMNEGGEKAEALLTKFMNTSTSQSNESASTSAAITPCDGMRPSPADESSASSAGCCRRLGDSREPVGGGGETGTEGGTGGGGNVC